MFEQSIILICWAGYFISKDNEFRRWVQLSQKQEWNIFQALSKIFDQEYEYKNKFIIHSQ